MSKKPQKLAESQTSKQSTAKAKLQRKSKSVTLRVPKKKQQLYTSINSIFGIVAFIALLNAIYIGYTFLAYDIEDGVYQNLVKSFINSLYYPIFYLFGMVLSRRAFFASRFQTGIWLALLVPLTPLLILSLSWNS